MEEQAMKKRPKEMFNTSFQLPYSCNTLYLRLFNDGQMYFSVGAEGDKHYWLPWKGDNDNYRMVKKDRFSSHLPVTKWDNKYEMGLVDQFVSLTYQAGLDYFKNVYYY